MNAAELVGMAFLKGEKHIKIWGEFKRHASDDTLRIIAEYEFESVISEVSGKIDKNIKLPAFAINKSASAVIVNVTALPPGDVLALLESEND